MPYQPWTKETLYFENDAYFKAMLSAIARAQSSIEMEMYIFLPDQLGRRVESALIAASQRGVAVRLLVDGIGALSWIGQWSKEIINAGVEIKIWNPVYSGSFLKGIFHSISKHGVARFAFNVNRRTHRKYVIVDSRSAFVGSQNIAAAHSPEFSGKQAWRDSAIEVEGPALEIIQKAFRHAWDRGYAFDGKRPSWFKRNRSPRVDRESPVRLNITRPMRFRFWRDLLHRIRSTSGVIWVTTPYLAPTRFLLRALIKAKKRGADIRILLPSESDVFFMRWIATSYYDFLLRNGIRVFEYQPRFLHAKSLILDDWAMLGTSNMNTRSFLHDLEIDIVLTGAQARAELRKQFEIDLAQASEIKREDLAQKIWISRLGEFVSFFLRYWI